MKCRFQVRDIGFIGEDIPQYISCCRRGESSLVSEAGF